MESKPWRAKARISSKCSQGFLARLRRSTRWALVSLTSGIGSFRRREQSRFEGRPLQNRRKKKAHVPLIWHVGFEVRSMKTLSSQAPQARSRLPTATAAGRMTTTDLARVAHIEERLPGTSLAVNPGNHANVGCV